MRQPRGLALAVILLAACAPSTIAQRGDELRVPVPVSEAEQACVDFYQSVEKSFEEESLYFPVLAQRIREAGHEDAAAILDEVAEEFRVGYWEGPVDFELVVSAQMAQAGRLLLAGGELRCAALGEFWGIDGYEGEPTPREMLSWQRQIWEANAVPDYKLLVTKLPVGEGGRQYHVEVVAGQVRGVWDAESGDRVDLSQVDDLPLTVDEIYQRLEPDRETTYDLVHAVPQRVDTLFIRFDREEFPEPLHRLERLGPSPLEN